MLTVSEYTLIEISLDGRTARNHCKVEDGQYIISIYNGLIFKEKYNKDIEVLYL